MQETNAQTPPQPVEPTQPIHPHLFPPKNIFSLIIGVLVLIILTATTTYFVLQSKSQTQTSDQPIVIPTHTLSNQPYPSVNNSDETTNWKTYKDDNYKFKLRYPNSWRAEKACMGGAAGADYICLSSPDHQANPAQVTEKGGLIFVNERDGSFGFGSTVNKFCESTTMDIVTECIQIVVGESIGFERFFKTYNFVDVGVVMNNKIVFTFRAQFSRESKEEILKIFDQILSTFAFLDQNQTNTNPNSVYFESKNLGISFSYLKQDGVSIKTLESGNKIYIYDDKPFLKPTDGQFVEVFTKNKDGSLSDAIKKMFLAGKPETECYVEDYPYATKYLTPNYQAAQISFPFDPSNSDLESMSKKTSFCSENYTGTNGNRYFLMDKNVPEKFFFFSIGQYAILADENKSWQDTIKITN